MQEFTLSDHAADQGTLEASKRQADFDAAIQRHKEALDLRKQKAIHLKDKSDAALREGRTWSWLGNTALRVAHSFSSAPATPQMASAGTKEQVWMAGRDGERRVNAWLGRFLSDEWIMVSGYRNGGGEIDKVLVGPRGVVAIEVKYLNGKVSCDGDIWVRDKYDKYGNLVERSVPIKDGRGRGPSAQLNASADRLQKFLSSRSITMRVARVIALSHDGSKIGDCRNQTVDLIATLTSFDEARLMSILPKQDAEADPIQLLQLLHKDHTYHEKKRAERAQSAKIQLSVAVHLHTSALTPLYRPRGEARKSSRG